MLISISQFTGYWWSSNQGTVQPGNTIYAWVKYSASDNSYNMYITCKETGFSVKSNIPVESGKLYTDTYFVIEHQPDSCSVRLSPISLSHLSLSLSLSFSHCFTLGLSTQWSSNLHGHSYRVGESARYTAMDGADLCARLRQSSSCAQPFLCAIHLERECEPLSH